MLLRTKCRHLRDFPVLLIFPLFRQIMPGYFKNDVATAETIFGDWLHTGDIGYYLEVTQQAFIDKAALHLQTKSSV